MEAILTVPGIILASFAFSQLVHAAVWLLGPR
jgi:hypothetical protein